MAAVGKQVKFCKAHSLRIAAVRDLRSERPLPALLLERLERPGEAEKALG
jgi:hypothetical protein